MSVFLLFDTEYYCINVRGLYTDIVQLKNNIILELRDDQYFCSSLNINEYLPNTQIPIKTYSYFKIFISDDIQKEIVLDGNDLFDPNLNLETGNDYFIQRELIDQITQNGLIKIIGIQLILSF